MLSRRLKALVTPTSQRRVTTTFIQSQGMNEVRTSAAIRTAAARTCPAAFRRTGNRLPRMSSARPTANARVAPTTRARSFFSTR